MTETTTMTRPGISWYTAPGVLINKQTLDSCIAEVFGFPEIYLTVKGRYALFIYAKHLKRYILERMLKNGDLADDNYRRLEGREHRKSFKYSLRKLGDLTNCDHATVIHSSKTCRNLMDTDRTYREKCNQVIEKLNNNLLILPE